MWGFLCPIRQSTDATRVSGVAMSEHLQDLLGLQLALLTLTLAARVGSANDPALYGQGFGEMCVLACRLSL